MEDTSRTGKDKTEEPASDELKEFHNRVLEAHGGIEPHLYHTLYCVCGFYKAGNLWTDKCPRCGRFYR